jgi:hypothetical protein
MEARRLEPQEPRDPPGGRASAVDFDNEPFSWLLLLRLIHPYMWALIAALWIAVAWLVLYEAR